MKDEAIGVLPIGEAEGALLFLFRFKRLYEKDPVALPPMLLKLRSWALPVPPCLPVPLRRCRWAWGDLPSRPSRTAVRGRSFKVLTSVFCSS